jgi:hypothetical protein
MVGSGHIYLFGNCFVYFFMNLPLQVQQSNSVGDSVRVLDAVLLKNYLGKENHENLTQSVLELHGQRRRAEMEMEKHVQLFQKCEILVGSLILVLFGNLVRGRNPGKKGRTQC